MNTSEILYQFSQAVRKQAKLRNDKLNMDYADVLENRATILNAQEIIKEDDDGLTQGAV